MVKTDETEPAFEPIDPKQVGREFVHTYYSLMNEGPEYLFRFYTNESFFVHGGIEKLGEEDVVYKGQKEIREKISSLKFEDCKAKVYRVDSQESLKGSVLVQTAGEIYSQGIMRRFLQSFVLVRKGPKSFYVHNDIFRYQDDDEKLSETEGTPVAAEGTESDISEEPVVSPTMEAPADCETAPIEIGDSSEASESQNSPANEQEEDEQGAEAKEEEIKSATSPEVEEKQEEDMQSTKQQEDVQSTKQQEDVQSTKQQEDMQSTKQQEDVQSTKQEEDMQSTKQSETLDDSSPEPSMAQAESSQGFSWAALVSKNTPTTVGSESAPAGAGAGTGAGTGAPVRPKSVEKPERKAAGVPAGPPKGEQSKAQRVQKENHLVRDRSNSLKGENGNEDNGNNRRSFVVGAKYPDDQQLFVGNLPHSMSEAELKTFFESFGGVLELRINTKSSGGRVPNFGFVVFDSAETAQAVLKQKPIFYNGEHRLNVEEKKTRSEQRPARGGARYGTGPRNYGSRGGPRSGDGRPYNGDRYSGGREFHKGGMIGSARQ